tara:strand:- start:133 stop:558 length:426 start_codon:yes stop_codon:yes gene_type:complete
VSIANQTYSSIFKRSISNKKLSRQFPLLAALHRLTDGALIGFVCTVVAMSAISLHAQHLWTLSFSRLETSRDLIQKLKESISILESHFLESESLPEVLVETKTSHLIYINQPDASSRLTGDVSTFHDYWNKFISFPVNHSY